MEINVQATVGVCTEFVGDGGEKTEISVVISPLKVMANEEQSKVSIIMGCNMWRSCQNVGCWYSVAARDRGGVK